MFFRTRPSPGRAEATWADMSPSAAASALPTLRVIDVRQPNEFYGDLGHIAGAELVPLDTFAQALTAWDRAAPVLVVCRSGRRAAKACDLLVRAGFGEVFNLDGGMLAWNAGGQRACARRHDVSSSRCAGAR